MEAGEAEFQPNPNPHGFQREVESKGKDWSVNDLPGNGYDGGQIQGRAIYGDGGVTTGHVKQPFPLGQEQMTVGLCHAVFQMSLAGW